MPICQRAAPVTGLEPWKGGRVRLHEIVAARCAVLEKLLSHARAHHVRARVVGSSVAEAIAVETGFGLRTAALHMVNDAVSTSIVWSVDA